MLSSATTSEASYHRLDAGPTPSPPSTNTTTTTTTQQAFPPAHSPVAQNGPPISSAVPSSSTNPFPIAPAPAPQLIQPAGAGAYNPQPVTPPAHLQPPQASQSQIICCGCRTLLVYPPNATNVRCALCSTVTAVPPGGTEMSQLVCGGCRTLLVYVRGASSVQCSCCHTVNLSMETGQVAHINCGGCGMTLMYAFGAQSVKCAICQFVSNVSVGQTRMPLPLQRPPYPAPLPPQPQTQTVLVENPMTMDDSGRMVTNSAVGVTSDK